ncbi:helix-turn-helix domain-containing protein [Pontibacter sp. MBLB2868]|uniref:helix-turn-helix domain-containing protein n=1 Tax=Pontibacter sp. MBLB2868 TaxID=3451555 RepID=UPI003F751F01
MKDINSKIKSIRLLKKLKQEDVAQALGMSKANYSRIEKGDVNLSPEKLEALQSVFDMSSEEIFNHETAEERLGLSNHGVLEEVVKQQAAQIERMQLNTERFLEALIKHQQKPSSDTLAVNDTNVADAIASVFAIDGVDYLLNKENLREDYPLLDAYKDFRTSTLAYGISLFIDALTKETTKALGLNKKK